LLDDLVTLAVQSHPSIVAKAAEVRGSKAVVDAARWQYFPTPSVLAERGANQTHKEVGTAVNAAVTGTTTLRLQQPLWSGGRLAAGVRASELKALAADAAVQEARLSVAHKTLEAWQGLLTAFGRVQANQKSVVQLAQLHEMMLRRVAQQVSPSIEAELSQSRLLQAQSELIAAQAAKEAAERRVAQWVGEFKGLPDAQMAQMAVVESQKLSLPVDFAAIALQLGHNIEQQPMLRRFEMEMAVAKQDIELKRAEQWPTLYARLDRQFINNANTVGQAANTVVYFGLEYSLGAGLTQRSAVELTLSKWQAMESERETIRRDIQDRLMSEWRDYQSAHRRAEQAGKVQQSTAQLLASYERLFVAGRRSWMELLNTVRELAAAEQTQSDLWAQLQVSRYRVRMYVGEWPWQNN
jgi:outer membrane protein, adhesin transport system